jgi:tellurite resistance protein
LLGSGNEMAKPQEDQERRRARPAGAWYSTIGLVQFGIPLGVCGSAGAWTAAAVSFGADVAVSEVLWALALVLYAIVLAIFILKKVHARESIFVDLNNPVLGPFVANLTVVALLLLAHFGHYFGAAAPWITWLLIITSLAVAARLLSAWFSSSSPGPAAIHAGWLFPVVAAGFVGSIALSAVSEPVPAAGAFAVGVFFWLVIGTVVTNRLITGGPLPDPIKPTMVVLSVPPALGGTAWIALHGGRTDAVAWGLFAIAVVLAVTQLMLIPMYRGLAFSQSFWTFTFPIGVTTNFTIRVLAGSPFSGSVVVSWVLLALASAAVATVGVLSIGQAVSRGRGRVRLSPQTRA